MSDRLSLPRLPRDGRPPKQLRFSLRTLLALMSLVCLAAPWAIQRCRVVADCRQQKSIAERLKACGAVPLLKRSGAVYSLEFSGATAAPLSRGDLQVVSRFTELETLDLTRTPVDSGFLAELRRLPQLRKLSVPAALVSVEAVEQLQAANPGLVVTPAPLWCEKQLPRVQQLVRLGALEVHLYRPTRIGAEDYFSVTLSGPKISDRVFAAILPLLERVEHLIIDGAPITPASIPRLSSLERLKHVAFQDTMITSDLFEEARRASRGITAVHFRLQDGSRGAGWSN